MRSINVIRWALGVALLVLAGWMFRETPLLRDLLRPVQSSGVGQWVDKQVSDVQAAGRDAVGSRASPQRGSSLRKCVSGAEVIYTNADCPAGSQRHEVSGGSVTVLPAQPARPAVSDAAASRTPLSELAGKPGEPTLKEKHLDRIQ
ncbi:hypothetical protein HLB44_14865 [Aquincola sp. S2]|uniref:DUF4124 domain-containing protein n=1 Tax=Pseudaquabacterium terrae TaxID=2732868 RepID=A0ABX2EI62_9BURK|nr:hypothetical protein [Aquabacterium terrae]NRF68272.1 hypothetical protein [Aquabacterium terrae]